MECDGLVLSKTTSRNSLPLSSSWRNSIKCDGVFSAEIAAARRAAVVAAGSAFWLDSRHARMLIEDDGACSRKRFGPKCSRSAMDRQGAH